MDKIIVNNYPLDKEQLKPILDHPKYSMIIAGAGSGKTMTLIGKVKYLLENQLFQPEEICMISFTNEAVCNLQKNILKNCGVEVPIFTFHKLALHILKQEHSSYQIAPTELLSYIIQEFFRSKCFGNKFLIKKCYQIFEYPSFFSWNFLLKSPRFLGIQNQIITFIHLCKANGIFPNDLKTILAATHEPFLYLIYTIYLIYESDKEASGILDFDDMILKTTETLKMHSIPLPYKMIIIDEFQDTSLCRFQFIQEMIRLTDASLCVVGDDYQSIYHFSGCDLSIFLNFTKYYPTAQVYKLEKTYRNSDELVKIAGEFIQKNPYQIRKNLISDKHLEKPVKLVFYKNIDNALEKVLQRIPLYQNILLLGRNHFDIQKYTKKLFYTQKENHQIFFDKFPNHPIRFLTIHSSKGLESDIVILLNLEHTLYGFPSLIQEEKIFALIKKQQPYPFEEERRLFYVGLTRTKSVVYVMVSKYHPSCFIKELKKHKNVEKIFL